MGNLHSGAADDLLRSADIDNFYSSNSWIEGKALDQLEQTAELPDIQKIATFPDLHPGKFGPVGCAILADKIYPHLIGNDIGCGISLYALDIPVRKIRVDKAAQRLRMLEGFWDGNTEELIKAANLGSTRHDAFLGTIGGGNHFCELQSVEAIYCEEAIQNAGIRKDNALLMIHSGSRSFGAGVFGAVQSEFTGIKPQTAAANAYLEGHCQAVVWASLNRHIIAMRAAEALGSSCRLIADSPHNLIEPLGDLFLHRKGAAKADIPLVPLAGSRDALSFLLAPTDRIQTALNSLAHGAGRKYDRRSMMGRVGKTKSDRRKLERTSYGGRVVCEDRQLLMEEAPGAYKDPQVVVNDLERCGLATKAMALKPLVTFKKAAAERKAERQKKSERLLQRRRER